MQTIFILRCGFLLLKEPIFVSCLLHPEFRFTEVFWEQQSFSVRPFFLPLSGCPGSDPSLGFLDCKENKGPFFDLLFRKSSLVKLKLEPVSGLERLLFSSTLSSRNFSLVGAGTVQVVPNIKHVHHGTVLGSCISQWLRAFSHNSQEALTNFENIISDLEKDPCGLC